MGWRSLSQEKSPRWKPSLRRASSCRLTLWQLQGLFPKVTTATWKKRTRPMCQQMRSGARAASRMKQKRVTALTYTSLLATLAMPTRGNIRMRSGATAISCMNQKRVTVLTCTSLLAIVATPRHGAAPFIVNMGEHCFWRTEIDTCMPLGLVRLHQGLSYNMSRYAIICSGPSELSSFVQRLQRREDMQRVLSSCMHRTAVMAYRPELRCILELSSCSMSVLLDSAEKAPAGGTILRASRRCGAQKQHSHQYGAKLCKYSRDTLAALIKDVLSYIRISTF
mmetsp:Transcript_67801/g.124780  ORF Transcript_67801/g.124780 Transcript_67801/m.124780 type:complete len:280 (+) Transcript_67801:422-1261(+)